MKTRSWFTVVGLVLVLGLLVPVSGSYAAPPPQEEEEALLYPMIPKTLDNPGFLIAKRGADARAAELGNVDVFWTASTTADAAQEVQVIESLMRRKPNGMLINSNGPSVCGVVEEALAAGIPVVMWDSDCPEVMGAPYVGSDNYEGGYMSGELYAEAVTSFLNGRGKTWRDDAGIDPENGGSATVRAMIDSYLSSEHLGDIDGQCPMIALPSDIARATAEARDAYQTLLRAMAWLFEHNLPQDAQEKRQTALALSALCVGGMVLSRTIDDASLADEVRKAAHDCAIGFVGLD